jgi:hypothetical protein
MLRGQSMGLLDLKDLRDLRDLRDRQGQQIQLLFAYVLQKITSNVPATKQRFPKHMVLLKTYFATPTQMQDTVTAISLAMHPFKQILVVCVGKPIAQIDQDLWDRQSQKWLCFFLASFNIAFDIRYSKILISLPHAILVDAAIR